jgi:hypothetical protein
MRVPDRPVFPARRVRATRQVREFG